jgi:hypothetical protein
MLSLQLNKESNLNRPKELPSFGHEFMVVLEFSFSVQIQSGRSAPGGSSVMEFAKPE